MPTQTKPWNTCLDSVEPDDQVFTDHKDPEKTVITNYKLKSTLPRCRLFIHAHRNHADFQNVKWEQRSADVVTMRTGSHNRSFGSVVVKFHLQTGVITIQGTAKNKWKDIYADLIASVDRYQLMEPPTDLESFISDLATSENQSERTISQIGLNDSLEIEDDVSDHESDVFEQTDTSKKEKTCSKDQGKSFSDDRSYDATLDALQNQYIKIIDGNNRAVENMSTNFESFKNHITKSFEEMKNQINSVKSSTEESVKTIASSLDSHHYDNNTFSERIKELHEELMVLKEQLTRYKDESFRIKKLNAELVAENSDLKSKLKSRRNSHLRVDTIKANANALPSPFRVSIPNVTHSPLREKSSANNDDTLSDEAIAIALENEGSVNQTFCSDRTSLNPGNRNSGPPPPPTVNPFESYASAVEHNQPTSLPQVDVQSQQGEISKIESSQARSKGSDGASYGSDSGQTGDDVTRHDVGSPSRDRKSGEGAGLLDQDDSNPIISLSNGSIHDDDDCVFSERKADRHQRLNLLLRAETVFVHDSTPQHIDFKRFMGNLQAYSLQSSTSGKALDIIKSWPSSDKMKYATIHEGVNDVTNKESTHIIINNLKSCLTELRLKFPNACIAYSEILFIGRTNRQSMENLVVDKVNSELKQFCNDNGFTYVPHTSLQSTTCALFRDEKHVNKDGGTAVLVSDIYYATKYKKPRDRTGGREFYNSNRVSTVSTSYKKSAHNPPINGKVELPRQDSSMHQILHMMCLSQQALVTFLNRQV